MYKIKPEGRSNIARNTVRKNSEMRKGTCRHKGKEKEYKKKKRSSKNTGNPFNHQGIISKVLIRQTQSSIHYRPLKVETLVIR